MVRLRIIDTGEGIPLKDLDKIFDPFFTTKSQRQGTGLGLSIVDKIVKEHNGYLEVSSKQNAGTTFALYFKREKPGRMVPFTSPLQLEKGTGDILVVDDDEIMRKTISRILYGMGYNVATAASGADTVRMCESGLHFNMIVLDVDMPVMSGLDTCRIIRSKIPEMRILFCTGRQHQYRMQEVLEEKNTWLITKPFSVEDLGKEVKKAMGRES